jgi:hypothetical protein
MKIGRLAATRRERIQKLARAGKGVLHHGRSPATSAHIRNRLPIITTTMAAARA